MRILNLEKLFEKEETLNEVLNNLKEDFEKVDYYANIMKTNITNNPEEVKSNFKTFICGVKDLGKEFGNFFYSFKPNFQDHRELFGNGKLNICNDSNEILGESYALEGDNIFYNQDVDQSTKMC